MSKNNLQAHIVDVGTRTFGEASMNSPCERGLRFVEEALELAQAGGIKLHEVLKLAVHVYEREPGVLTQEFGGAGVTLHAFANSWNILLDYAVQTEIDRVEANIEKIRAKAALKPASLFHVKPLPPTAQEQAA